MARPKQNLTDLMIDAATGRAVSRGDRRRKNRLPYHAPVAVMMIGPNGQCGRPQVMKAKDLSFGGICLISRAMMYHGSRGAMQIMRSNGELALVGVQVRHCRYIGDMQHHVGMKFIPLPEEMTVESFLDKRGMMPVLDEALRAHFT